MASVTGAASGVSSGSAAPKWVSASGQAARRMPLQTLPGIRVVTSWTSHALPSGSLKEQNDP